MNLAIYSDLHLEFAAFAPPEDLQADVVILAGDIHAPGRRVASWARREANFGDRPVIHVAGNHEFYGSYYPGQRRLMVEQAQQHGVHHLQMSSVVIQGVRFLGTTLWTDFELPVEVAGAPVVHRDQAMASAARGLNDFHLIRMRADKGRRSQEGQRPFTPADALEMHLQERAWLLAALREPFDGPTVVITHHAPNIKSVVDTYRDSWLSPCFCSDLPPEFFEVPRLWVHGHIHDSVDYTVGSCRVICNPRGYPSRLRERFENEAFDPRLIVEI